MQLHKRDVIDAATAILDNFGMADLTMRRLAREPAGSPGAPHWHFAHKHELLGADSPHHLEPRRDLAAPTSLRVPSPPGAPPPGTGGGDHRNMARHPPRGPPLGGANRR